ncbi:MAG: stage II sporulation protein R [Clostridiales bacterium]|nr:stage II sporulation protein R [Clostridiales bacterium]
MFAFDICIYCSFYTNKRKLSREVFRLHILANSDSQEDQNLKLKVRDAVLNESNAMFKNCSSLEEMINLCESKIDFFKETAESCLRKNGCDYSVNAYVDREYFNTREYDEITLPSGMYNALKIEIGKAEGHNWWCVMFPAICLPSVSESELNNVLNDDELELVASDNKYEIRFKIVEIYEKIKSKIQN